MEKKCYTEKELHILFVAAEEFNLQGYTAASTNTIAKNAAVAKGLIFHYFENKENLYIALLTYALEQLETNIYKKIKTLSTYMDAFIIIKELILIRAEFALSHPSLATALFRAFNSETTLPITLTFKIENLKQQYDTIFNTFLDGLFLRDTLSQNMHNDSAVFYKILIMMEAALNYELQTLIKNDTFESIDQIPLQYYENIIKHGILSPNK